MTEQPQRRIYWPAYFLGILLFSYSIMPARPLLLYLAIISMFVAYMKPVYDWYKQNKENGDTDDNR